MTGYFRMYKSQKTQQLTFQGFNQSCGTPLDQDDEWVVLADRIDWRAVELEYQQSFKSGLGRPAVPARQAFGALIIQKRTGLSDRELIKEIARNVSFQYFIGLEAFQTECPFKHGVLPSLRKRFDKDVLIRLNEVFLKKAQPTQEHANDPEQKPTETGALGTMILDATCSPSNIRYPQDFSLLNEAREKLDDLIDLLHDPKSGKRRPRTYRKVLRKQYLAVAKSKRRTDKQKRSIIRILLNAVKRNLNFVDRLLQEDKILNGSKIGLLETIRTLYEQQKEMFEKGTHRVANRIVSLEQPFIRPIVRGKARAQTEFGAKYDVSIDEKGHARLEHINFEPYNECLVLQKAVEKFKKRTGHYPQRVLVDQIYRTRANRAYCAERGIEMSGRTPGRPAKDDAERRREEKLEHKKDIDRIEVERFFSLAKRRSGAGLIRTKLSETTLASIALSVLVANLFGVQFSSLFFFFFVDSPDGEASCHLLEFEENLA